MDYIPKYFQDPDEDDKKKIAAMEKKTWEVTKEVWSMKDVPNVGNSIFLRSNNSQQRNYSGNDESLSFFSHYREHHLADNLQPSWMRQQSSANYSNASQSSFYSNYQSNNSQTTSSFLSSAGASGSGVSQEPSQARRSLNFNEESRRPQNSKKWNFFKN